MRISLGADDRADVVDAVIAELERRGHELRVYEPAQWPEVAHRVASDVAQGRADQGVLFCWTGTGTSIVANKVPGVRAALVWEPWIAEGARLWNDANVLVMSLKSTSPETVAGILDAWFKTEAFDDSERVNIRRITEIEQQYSR